MGRKLFSLTEMKLLNSVLFASAFAAEWSYPEQGGHWGDTCKDQKAGSPIDFDCTYRNFNVKYLDYENNEFFKFTGWDVDHRWNFQNNGHSIVFTIGDVNYEDKETTVSGGHLERPYMFHSMHFHWGNSQLDGGSEHTINGRHHFAELHMVHYGTHCKTFGECVADDEETGRPVYNDGLAVLGFFVELDPFVKEEDINPVLKRLVNKAQWLNQKNIDKKELVVNGNFALDELAGHTDTMSFYRYQGSLTTPGCNEVVRWTVFKDTMKINRNYARKFVRTIGKGKERLDDNFRGVQDLADRIVTFYTPSPSVAVMALANERHFDAKQKRRRAPFRYGYTNEH